MKNTQGTTKEIRTREKVVDGTCQFFVVVVSHLSHSVGLLLCVLGISNYSARSMTIVNPQIKA